MTRKIIGFALCALLFALCSFAEAQQPAKAPRIGYMTSFGAPAGRGVSAFLQGLRDLGYVEGQNVQIEYRHPKGNFEGTPELVAELVQLKVNVIVAVDPSAIRSAKQATKTIPIVMVTNQDPVATGLVDSLAHPGGNVTGLSLQSPELRESGWSCLLRSFPNFPAWPSWLSTGSGSPFVRERSTGSRGGIEGADSPLVLGNPRRD